MPRRLRSVDCPALAWGAIVFCGATWSVGAQSSLSPDPLPLSATGCLVREAEYAARYGLSGGRESMSDSPGQLVLVMADRGSNDGATSIGAASTHVARAYVVTGVRERDLVAHAGTRVNLDGVVEARLPRATAATATQTATGAAGVTPDGSPAHEPGDATPETTTADSGSVASVPRSPVAIRDLPRLNVRTIRLLEQACALPPSEVVSEAPRSSSSVAAVTPVPPASSSDPAAWSRVTVVGCVVRETDPANPATTVLALRKATVRPPAGSRLGQGAVPGSLPSGSGSGTVGSSAAAEARSPADEQGFALIGYDAALADHVDRRVEMTGVLAPLAQVSSVQGLPVSGARTDVSQVAVAHQSAPHRQLRVQSFRPLGSGCAR